MNSGSMEALKDKFTMVETIVNSVVTFVGRVFNVCSEETHSRTKWTHGEIERIDQRHLDVFNLHGLDLTRV